MAVAVLAGVAVWVAWALEPHAWQGYGLAVAALALVLVAGCAVRAWWRSLSAEIGWNGQAWTWPLASADPDDVVPGVMLDLQFVMLVRLGRTGSWLWLERWREPRLWSDIRRAVYSRASHAAPRQPHRQNRADAAS